MSIYMLIAIRYEEHDLIGLFGKDYRGLSRERRDADAAFQTAEPKLRRPSPLLKL